MYYALNNHLKLYSGSPLLCNMNNICSLLCNTCPPVIAYQ